MCAKINEIVRWWQIFCYSNRKFINSTENSDDLTEIPVVLPGVYNVSDDFSAICCVAIICSSASHLRRFGQTEYDLQLWSILLSYWMLRTLQPSLKTCPIYIAYLPHLSATFYLSIAFSTLTLRKLLVKINWFEPCKTYSQWMICLT